MKFQVKEAEIRSELDNYMKKRLIKKK